MSAEKKLSLKDAQGEFMQFLERVKPKDVAPFLQWVEESFSTEKEEQKPKFVRDATERLLEIKHHLVQRVPAGGQLSSEKIAYPTVGFDSDCNATNTAHVDCFLFDEEDIDDLVEKGELTRTYCLECGSRNTKPLTFISHSLAPAQLEFAFTKLVPLKTQKAGFRVVDIGSRLGAVIYAASLYGAGNVSVTGVELNEDLCKIQKDVIEKFGLEGIDVVCSDVTHQKEVIKNADLIIMNNVFSFFLSVEEQESCWDFIHEHASAGCLIVHNPDMKDVVAHLNLPFTLDSWLEKISTGKACADFAGDNENVFEDCNQLCFYRVKPYAHCMKTAT